MTSHSKHPRWPMAWLVPLALLAGLGLGAQTVDPNWRGPYRLSTLDGAIAHKSVAADSRGVFHVFWIEERLFEQRFTLSYAQFDGKTWSQTVILENLQTPFAGAMTRLGAKVDSADTIHLVWSGNSAPVIYRTAAAGGALNPAAWSSPRKIDVATFRKELLLEVQGSTLLFYSAPPNPDPGGLNGIFFTRSDNGAATWSKPVQLDSSIPPTWMVLDFDAEFDGHQALHVTWSYIVPSMYQVKEVRYAHSLDAGHTWSTPIVIDKAPQDDPDFIRLAIPVVKANGPAVHIIWGGGGIIGVGRRHRISTDYGSTWNETQSVFGGLHGVAGTDSAIFDSLGRLHLFGQWRWPQGIYHAVWAAGQWNEPRLIYLIAKDSNDILGGRVHAHRFGAALSVNDQFLLAFETCGGGCGDTSTWPANPIGFALYSEGPLDGLPLLTSVSSADFTAGRPAAPEMIAAGFSVDLASASAEATQLPLPLKLGGVEVEVTDSSDARFSAELFFVSPTQVNYLIPAGMASGRARVYVRRDGDLAAAGVIDISRVAPGVFTINAAGTGIAAASWLRVAADGKSTEGLLFDPKTLKPVAVSNDTTLDQLYLILYGTGFRGFADKVTATIGGISVPVLGAAPQGQFSGLDQINIGPLPPQVAGGEREIALIADGAKANPVTVLLK